MGTGISSPLWPLAFNSILFTKRKLVQLNEALSSERILLQTNFLFKQK